jgi:hypothetical protein
LNFDLLRFSTLGAIYAEGLGEIVNAAMFFREELDRGPNEGEVHHDPFGRIVNGDTLFYDLLFELLLKTFGFGARG